MASIDEYRGRVYLAPLWRTTMGVGIGGTPIRQLPSNGDDAELGECLLEVLDGSERVVPHPNRDEFAYITEPLRQAAGVRTFRMFEREAEHVSARLVTGTGLVLIPYENRVARREGYRSVNRARVVVSPDDPTAIGAAIKATLRRAAEARERTG